VGGGQRANIGSRSRSSSPTRDAAQQGDPRLPGYNGSRMDSAEASEWEKREHKGYLAQVAEKERALGEGGRRLGGGVIIDYLFFLFFLFISYVKHQKMEERGNGDLRRIRSGGEKGFVICCHDIYGRMQNDETKKQYVAVPPRVG